MAAKKKYDRTKQKETLVKVLEYIKHYRAVLVFSLILAAVTVAWYALSSYSDRRMLSI